MRTTSFICFSCRSAPCARPSGWIARKARSCEVIGSVPAEIRLALFLERGHAFFRVLRRRHHRHHCLRVFERFAEPRSAQHTSEHQSLMRSSYAVVCLQKKNTRETNHDSTSYKIRSAREQ